MKLGESKRVGFGHSPALIVVDVGGYMTDPASPSYVPDSVTCVRALCDLLAVARQTGIPRLFTRNGKNYFTQKTLPFTDAERGAWAFKSALHERIKDPKLWELAPELNRQPDEIILEKTKSSAFFCSPLIAYLNQMNVDTLIIGGMMTSGCVRCTIVDAFQYNFRVIVPLEGCADSRPHANDTSLEDIDLKYGDVMPTQQIIDHLRGRQQKAG